MGQPEQAESNGRVVLGAEGQPAPGPDHQAAVDTEDVLAEPVSPDPAGTRPTDPAPDGTAPDGTAPTDPAPTDREPAGSGPSGSAPDGTTTTGSGTTGSGTTGTAPDGTGTTDEPVGPVRTWRTRGDYLALALLVVGVLVASTLVWAFSDARHTVSQTGPSQVTPLPPATVLPPTLAEVWRAPSGATPAPVALDSVVVTGHDGEVVGRDALTGDVRWRYSRNWPLCTVSTAWGKAFALYRKDTNCSELTTLDMASGKRGPQRNGDAALDTRLLDEGSHVVTTGETYFEVYRRDDLVRSLEYGTLRAIVNANKQPRPGCRYGSFAVSSGKVAVVERCHHQDPSDRITVLKPNPEKSDEPHVLSSVIIGEKDARVVAVTGNRVAVAAPGKLIVFDAETGGLVQEHPVDVTADELRGDPPGRVVPTLTSTANVYWFTGSRTVALSLVDLSPVWSTPSRGPGTTLAGRVLIPVPEGLRVVDQVTGAEVGRIPVDRGGYDGPVQLATEGPVVLEQRGDTLVALR
ncbi:PQQ-binding-like beta-propeller repeat protein [Saccharothrix australiensis]|uniref:Putative pyrroloquinoline-quinone binding quinoprotein n=1 Tax=Saccharothrix australiensis TaxID=2072 RepID=A0A495VTG1_9PSEU|nr:PQQ-binding-like beta-propeller repeat protein [Saccharothrix australiensis]RKT52681.1 putative pyrroloquinoline-quinone binding quinoprotein [Saccharothrix australiensis]